MLSNAWDNNKSFTNNTDNNNRFNDIDLVNDNAVSSDSITYYPKNKFNKPYKEALSSDKSSKELL